MARKPANKEQAPPGFALGYSAGMRSMLMSINEGGPGDFIIGDDPLDIKKRTSMSKRLMDQILKATRLN